MHDRRHDQKGRSTGQFTRQASKHAKINGQFAPRTIEMLRSPAMGVTSLAGRRILDRLEIEMGDHGGTDNGQLPCTYDDFERFGIHRHQIAAAIAELVALGFIEITRPGRAGNAEYRLAALYRLTYRHTAECGPTEDWKRHKTDVEAKVVAAKARAAAIEAGRVLYRKRQNQKPSGGFCQVSVTETATKNSQIHSAETATTCPGAETTTTFDISGRGAG